jgi:hypothetical protein
MALFNRMWRDFMSSVETMSTWEVIINNYNDLPDNFKVPLKFISCIAPFPYTIYLPVNKNISNRRNAKLITIFNSKLYIYEDKTTFVEEICYKISDIEYIERGTVLLFSWIEINGISNGKKITTKIDYNTVTNKIFTDGLNLIRFGRMDASLCTDETELSKLNYLSGTDYKYYSHSKDSIYDGEHIVYSLYQPEICKKIARTIAYRVSPTHISIITEKELIIVSEEFHAIKKKSEYGVIFKYIPLSKIKNLDFTRYNEDNNCALNIFTKDSYSIKLLYTYSNESNVKNLTKLLRN